MSSLDVGLGGVANVGDGGSFVANLVFRMLITFPPLSDRTHSYPFYSSFGSLWAALHVRFEPIRTWVATILGVVCRRLVECSYVLVWPAGGDSGTKASP